MQSHYSDYPIRARSIADASETLLEALADSSMDRGIAIVDLETAATSQATSARQRFEPAEASPATPPESPENTLAGLLLELQSANALISAGMAMNEHGAGAETKFLREASAQTRSASTDVAAHIAKAAKLQFAPQAEPSKTVDEAIGLLRSSAGRTLTSITKGTEGVISSAFSKLKELDKTKISQAIDDLGKSFTVVQTAGRLLKQGLDKLKAVLDALANLCGGDVIEQIKTKVREIWDKLIAGAYVDKLVPVIIGVAAAEAAVDSFLGQSGLPASRLDSASRELALLEDSYQGKRRILDGLVSAVVLAMGIVGALQYLGLWAAAPWVGLAAAGAYALVIGVALVVGMNYTGSRRLLGWSHGVSQIVQGANAAAV